MKNSEKMYFMHVNQLQNTSLLWVVFFHFPTKSQSENFKAYKSCPKIDIRTKKILPVHHRSITDPSFINFYLPRATLKIK